MNKLLIAAAAFVVAGISVAATTPKPAEVELRRVDCTDLTVFAPDNGKTPKDLCKSYGGLARAGGTPNSEGLVILVRNQPVGGFEGQSALQ
ncbi:antitermination protein [Roseibium hamelinense]|nr:antitermination protein [Roseibium hamelinense]